MPQVKLQIGDRGGARSQLPNFKSQAFNCLPDYILDFPRARTGVCFFNSNHHHCSGYRLPVVLPPPAGLPLRAGGAPLLRLRACTCVRARWGLPRPFPRSLPPSLAGKLRASISLLIALIRDRGGVNWKTLVLCLFGEENVNKN